MTTYYVSFRRTYKVEANSPTQAVDRAVEITQAPDAFTFDEVDEVEEDVTRIELRPVPVSEYRP